MGVVQRWSMNGDYENGRGRCSRRGSAGRHPDSLFQSRRGHVAGCIRGEACDVISEARAAHFGVP